MAQGKIWPHSAIGHQMLNSGALSDEFESILGTSDILSGIVESLTFNLPLLTSAMPTTANDYTITYPAAGSVRTVPDHEGILRHVNSGELRFEGARRVENLAPYSDMNDNTLLTTGDGTLTDGGDGTVISAVNTVGDRAYAVAVGIPANSNATYMISFDILENTVTDEAVYQQLCDVVGTTPTFTGPLSQRPAAGFVGRFATTFTQTSDTTFNVRVGCGSGGPTSGGTGYIKIGNLQIEEISGQSVTAPGEYVDPETDYNVGSGVTGVRCFNTELGNTWNSSTGAVSDGAGAMLSDSTMRGWLCEPSTTNLCPASDFDSAEWVAIAATKNTGEIGIDGRATAVELVEDTSTGLHRLTDVVTHTAGATCTMSFYVKAGSGSPFVRIYCVWTGTAAGAVFDVVNQTFDSSAGTGYINSGIEIIDSEWSRVWMVVEEGAASDATAQFDIRLHNGTSDNYTGDGSTSVIISAPMFEEKNQLSSWMPEGGGTRAADINLGYAISNVDSALGSVEVELTENISDDPEITTTNYIIWGDNTGSRFAYRTSGSPEAILMYDGSLSGQVDTEWGLNEDILYRCYWDANQNGGEMRNATYTVTDDYATLLTPRAFDGEMNLGSNLELHSNVQYPARMKNLKIWPTNRGDDWLVS